jgi:hypothetical protein
MSIEQSTSLALFLEQSARIGTIVLQIDKSLLPHGIAGFDVVDIDAFVR